MSALPVNGWPRIRGGDFVRRFGWESGQLVDEDSRSFAAPNQPRAPKGSPTGGQWIDGGAGGSLTPAGPPIDSARESSGSAGFFGASRAENEARSYVIERAETFAASLTPAQRNAVVAYGYKGDQAMNGLLRHGVNPVPQHFSDRAARQHIETLDQTVRAAPPLDRDVYAYRGAAGAALAARLTPGTTFTDAGFTSMSGNHSTAGSFIDMAHGHVGDPRILMRVRLPTGTRVAAVSEVTGMRNEDELLAPRGSRFRVVSTGQRSIEGQPVITVELEYLGSGPPAAQQASESRATRAAQGNKFAWVPDDVEFESPDGTAAAERQAGAERAFHLPGQHDQKTHGRGGGGGESDRSAMTDRERAALAPKDWVAPPPLEGKMGAGKAGGYSSDAAYGTNTALGRIGEKSFVDAIGGKILHPPGKGEQSPLDVQINGYGFEVKAVSTRSTKYAATPKPYEIAQKEQYARDLGLTPALVIAVMDSRAGRAHFYWREGLAGGRLAQSTGWQYMGSGALTRQFAEELALLDDGAAEAGGAGEPYAFHLPGQHSQKSHGGGGTAVADPSTGAPVTAHLTNTLDRSKNAVFHGEVNRGLAAIAAVHRVEASVGQIPIGVDNTMSALGQYIPGPNNAPGQITMNVKGPHRAMTVIHEVGHALDSTMFGWSEPSGKRKWGSHRPDGTLGEIMATLRTTATMNNLYDSPPTPYLKYLGGRVEIFARAYAQYIATKRNDPNLLSAITAARNSTGPTRYSQWSGQEFAPVVKLFDRLFAERGLLAGSPSSQASEEVRMAEHDRVPPLTDDPLVLAFIAAIEAGTITGNVVGLPLEDPEAEAEKGLPADTAHRAEED